MMKQLTMRLSFGSSFNGENERGGRLSSIPYRFIYQLHNKKNYMRAKEKRFINWVKKQCKENGIKCDLRKVKYLKLSGNIKCSGYFDEDERKLVVAMNRPDWLGILVHEYCHLTQWTDGVKVWTKGCEGLTKVEEWLEGKSVRGIKTALAQSRDLELDNEKRSVALMKKWGLKIDIDDYIRKANAYVMFYNYMYHSRKWSSPDNSPYSNPNIISKMSNKFNMRYKQMSERLLKLYKEQNI